MSAFGYRRPSDLPRTFPVFPLAGAILFPRGALPLNIFEPRYLNMVDDALGAARVIGMVQPAAPGLAAPPLSGVGTLGRITAFAETEDGRYLITLTGVCRFRIAQELQAGTPYRQAAGDFDEFADDLKGERHAEFVDRTRLSAALEAYGAARGFAIDWSAVEEADSEALVHAVATLCPFDSGAKQMLLEAPTLADRSAALVTLLELAASDEGRIQ